MNKKVKWVGILSTAERNHIGLIRVRQNNVNSEVLGFEIIDGNGEPYDLKNRKVLFCTYFDKLAPVEQYAEVIEDGKIVYTMNQHDMQKPVRINFAYFKILDEKDNLVDTTQNFSYDIMPSIESKCMNSEPYIIRLEEVLDAFLQINTDAKKELEQIIIDFNEQVIKQQNEFNAWFESIKDILESVDPGGILLSEIIESRGNYPRLNKRIDTLENLANGFFQKVLSTTKKITLIGDSITEGVGAMGHTVPPDNPIIFDFNGEVYKEGCYSCGCWANKFRNYINKYYPTIEFVNKGIGGKSTRWAMQDGYKEAWLGNDADMVFVMLGMNDRTLGDFKQNITSFLKYINENCNNMIVMIPNPTLNDDASINREVRTINDTVVQVCQENDYFFISHYIDMLEHIDNLNQPLEDYVQSNGSSHPIDKGFNFMWKNIQNKLKFIDDQNDYGSKNIYNQKTVSQLPLNFANSSKSITEYPIGASTCAMQSSSQNEFGLPDGAGAIVNTYRTELSGIGYSYQEIIQYGTNTVFRRTVLENGDWSRYIPSSSGSVSVKATFGEIASMKVSSSNINVVTQTGMTFNKDKYAISFSPSSALDTNILFNAVLDDNGRFAYIRLFNASATTINPGEVTVDIIYTRKPY